MVLCQVYTESAAPQLYNINVFGKKKVKIVKMDYMYTAGDRMIGLRSNILRMPYGNVPYFIFVNNPNHQVGNIHSDLEFEANFNGNLDLEIFDVTTNAAPAGFQRLCLTLDITDIE